MKHKVVNSTYTTSHELSLLEFDSGCWKLPSLRCGFYEFVAWFVLFDIVNNL
jgi:hypothetical protein